MRMLSTLAVVLIALSAGPALGQEPMTAHPALADLGGVAIAVEPVDSALADKGMTTFVFSVQLERALKDRGVPVLNIEGGETAPGDPTLYLTVTAVVDDRVDHCAYSLRLELTQNVNLERNPVTRLVRVPTWTIGGVGVYGKGWRQAMLDDLVRFTDEFALAYEAANHNGETR